MKTVKLGLAPTRRSIFSAPDAVKYANLTRGRLRELGVEFVDIDDISADGLLHNDEDRIKIEEKFKREKVDGLFFPHGNFGTEYEVARLAKNMGLPVLLWGPRDERPDENGIRLRDSQCGLFATGKVLRRFKVPFTYLTNCRLTDPEFERGVKDFLAVCNVVKTFKNTRILQIGPRPFDFWSTMCNEGELLEKFNIQLAPIPLPELTQEVKKAKEEKTEVAEVMEYCHKNMIVKVKEEELENIDALVIMQVHNKDVYEELQLKDKYTDYEVPFDRSNYAAAYDYVIKRYLTECYELRNDTTSKYYNTPYGKPAIIVLCTHWHDCRTVYNESIRKLAAKWGFPLIEFDKYIGFSKNVLHPVTGKPFSQLYSTDIQVTEGIAYGHHPIRGEQSYMQQRMAAIFVDSMNRILPIKY